MSDTLIGAIIGAGIALSGTIITALIGLLMWTRNLRYQIFRDERDRLERRSKLVLEEYGDCLKNNYIDASLSAAIEIEFPEPIRNAFHDALKKGAFKPDEDKVKQHAYFDMAFAMSRAIAGYDKDIRKTYELIDPRKAMEIATEIIQTGVLKW